MGSAETGTTSRGHRGPTPAQSRRRDAVLAAAERLIRAQGYGATRMEDVARESGVSLGTIYSYFGSKSGIMAALIAPMTARMEARGRQVLDTPPDRLIDALSALYEAFRFEDDWRSVRFLEAFGLSQIQEDTQVAAVHAHYERFIEGQFEELLTRYEAAGRLRPGLDTGDMAYLLFHLMLDHFSRFVMGAYGPSYEAMLVDMHRRMRVMATGWEIEPAPDSAAS